VIVLANQLEQARRAEAGAADDGGGVAESGGMCANFGDEGLGGFKHRVGAASEVVGMAFAAGAQTRGAGGLASGKEADVLPLWFARRAGRKAVDAGGADADEKAAVVGRIARHEPVEHAGFGEAWRTGGHGGRFGRGRAHGNHGAQ